MNARTGQVLPLYVSILDDWLERSAEYDVPAAVQARALPTLVIHGDADEAVAVDEARYIADAFSHEDSELVILPGAGHTFGTAHPFGEPSADFLAVAERCQGWFDRHLQ